MDTLVTVDKSSIETDGVPQSGLPGVLCSLVIVLILGLLLLVELTSLRSGQYLISIIAAVAGIVAIASAYQLYRRAFYYEKRTETEIAGIIDGDLRTNSPVTGHKKTTEVTNALFNLRKKLSKIILRITAGKTTLDATVDELTIIADDTQKGAERLGMEANSLAAASEQLSSNVLSMASAADELSTSSGMVAAAIEEMASSINEVAKNSGQGAKIAQEVSQKATEAEKIMSQMGQATKQISSVVIIMQKIADQTNLLALNATIEAASAGESGKGFAVVANEVKDLARQSLVASDQISQQVEQVQKSTHQAIAAIQQVFAAIGEISSVSGTIAAAVEQQSATSSEVARSITNVSSATAELAHNIQQASSASEEVAKRSVVLEGVARQTSLISSQTRIGVDSINDIRKGMESVVASFKLDGVNFDISKVKSAHMNWVKRLQSVLRGELQLKPEEVTEHTACEFGKWFFGDSGKKLSAIPAYAEVGKFHEQVHRHAREVVRLYGNKQYNDAQKIMTDFETARNNLFSRLNDLYIA